MTVQWRCRGDGGPARYGFTVTKRTARKAVERNRIRRRLREAVRRATDTGAANMRRGYDIVLVGRRNAMTLPFEAVIAALAADLGRIPACACAPEADKGE